MGASLLILGVMVLIHPEVAASVCWLIVSLRVAEPKSVSQKLFTESFLLLMPLAF